MARSGTSRNVAARTTPPDGKASDKAIPRDRIAGARALMAVNKARKRPTEQWVVELAAEPLTSG